MFHVFSPEYRLNIEFATPPPAFFHTWDIWRNTWKRSPLYIACGTWKNSALSLLRRLWELEKFRTLPSMYGLYTLRKPKIMKAKRDMKHVSIAGSVTGILLPTLYPPYAPRVFFVVNDSHVRHAYALKEEKCSVCNQYARNSWCIRQIETKIV